MNMRRKSRTFFTIILMMAPFLSLYATAINSVSFLDLVLVIVFLLYVICFGKLYVSWPIVWFIVFILMQLAVTIFRNKIDISDVVLRTFHYLLYLGVLAVLTNGYFDINFGEKVYKFISIISSVFLIIQLAVVKLFSFYIPGFFTNLPLMRIEMLWHALNHENRFTYGPRPRSFFSEPQIYASFVVGYIAILLEKNQLKKGEKTLVVFLSVAVVVSLSTTGIVALLFVWALWFLKQYKTGKIGIKILIATFIGFIGLLVFMFLYSYNMIFSSHSVAGRFDAYKSILTSNMSLWDVIIGHGMIDLETLKTGSTEVFLPSILRVFYYYGVTGLGVVGVFFLKLYRNTQKKYKWLLLLMLLLLVGTVDFFGIMILTCMPYVIAEKENCLELIFDNNE